MQRETIRGEISEIVLRRLSEGRPVPVTWVCHEFLNKHNRVEGEDVDLYKLAAYSYARDIAKRVIGKFDTSEETGQMDLLPGEEHIRTAYSIKRGDEFVLVPTEQCSDQELLARANEFERNAKGLRAHARDLRRYVGVRRVTDKVAGDKDSAA